MIYLYRVYQWLIAMPIFIVLTVLASLTSIVGGLFSHRWAGYWAPMIWSRLTCWLFMMRVKVIGKEQIGKKQSYVFVANHQGAFDIWAIYGFLPHRFKWLMKKSLEKVPAVGFACRMAGHIFVDDSSIVGIKRTISDAEKMLRQGMSVVIFPEGTRTYTGEMSDFKRGAFMLAAEFGLPVVPLSVQGSFRAMPRTTYNMRPSTITLTIHEPITPPEGGFNTKRLMARCREEIQQDLL